MRVLVDGRAVGEVGHGDEVLIKEEGALIGAAAQALIAVAALGRAGDADAIADAHAAHFGSNGFDDADAAVSLDVEALLESGFCAASVRTSTWRPAIGRNVISSIRLLRPAETQPLKRLAVMTAGAWAFAACGARSIPPAARLD